MLPEKISEDMKSILMECLSGKLLEVDHKTANETLVLCSPKDSQSLREMEVERAKAQAQAGGPATASAALKRPLQSAAQKAALVTYCNFPPNEISRDSVSIARESYCSLEDETFLNDEIINFYFRWLQERKMSEADRKRTHFFNTHFYSRLTMPWKNKTGLHPVEDNLNMSPAEKRYKRIKRWTKKVNIFEKDFVFVPINQK